MSRRFQLGLKLAVSSAAFLCLTVVTAVGLRHVLHADQDRSPASIEGGSVFEHRGNLNATELGLLGSTSLIRGRRVVFHEAQFKNQALNSPNQVVLNLFPDVTLTAQMQMPSVYTVNEGLYVGQIIGDSDSSVRILLQNGVVDGTIVTHGFEYRIIDGAGGQSIVTQAKKSSP